MKIQCTCGAKFAFDITPEMAGQGVKFVCPQCGLDSSDHVNHLLREELARLGAPPGTPVRETIPVAAPVPPPMRVHVRASRQANQPAETAASPKPCPKHP